MANSKWWPRGGDAIQRLLDESGLTRTVLARSAGLSTNVVVGWATGRRGKPLEPLSALFLHSGATGAEIREFLELIYLDGLAREHEALDDADLAEVLGVTAEGGREAILRRHLERVRSVGSKARARRRS